MFTNRSVSTTGSGANRCYGIGGTLAFRFSPRPRHRSAVCKYIYDASIEYIENGAGRLESRERAAEFALEFQNADRLSVNYTNAFEFLPAPFPIGGDVVLPVGGYQFDTFRAGYSLGQHRAASAN